MKKRWDLGRIIAWVSTLTVSFFVLFPVYWIFISSLTSWTELFNTPINYFPKLTFENYRDLFKVMDMGALIGGTMLITAVSMVVTIALGFLASYSIIRVGFTGASIVMGFLLMSQLMPSSTTIIPMYDFMKSLNLVDNYPGLILLYISNLLPFTVMIFTTFIRQVPVEIEEAAFVDGANRLKTLMMISFPLLKPAVATMCIINFINCLNEFFLPMIFSIKNIQTLSIGIGMIPRINQFNIPWEKISAMGTLMVLPIVLFVVFFQENIMEGLSAGGVKM